MAITAAVGVHEALPVDTTPGANHVFAPPDGWSGSKKEYLNLMRLRWSAMLSASQQIAVTSNFVRRYGTQAKYVGPFADEARYVIQSLNEQR